MYDDELKHPNCDIKYSPLESPPEYFPPQWNARGESTADMQSRYKREYDKLKEYASFDRTLCEIESLSEIRTEYGD